jgi:hypothetical protein
VRGPAVPVTARAVIVLEESDAQWPVVGATIVAALNYVRKIDVTLENHHAVMRGARSRAAARAPPYGNTRIAVALQLHNLSTRFLLDQQRNAKRTQGAANYIQRHTPRFRQHYRCD